jgi:hypothetical protein
MDALHAWHEPHIAYHLRGCYIHYARSPGNHSPVQISGVSTASLTQTLKVMVTLLAGRYCRRGVAAFMLAKFFSRKERAS